MTDYSPYQKGVIKRFYEHRDTLALQKLAEIVSDLYVATSEAKIKRTWGRVEKQLLAAGVHKHQAQALVADQDLGALAKLIGELN
ncbi:MAG: hypothetical protein P8N09_05915 [Planctomycetota bacterium]|nr:hypothetical protein [Planctomycetota bacterium]